MVSWVILGDQAAFDTLHAIIKTALGIPNAHTTAYSIAYANNNDSRMVMAVRDTEVSLLSGPQQAAATTLAGVIAEGWFPENIIVHNLNQA